MTTSLELQRIIDRLRSAYFKSVDAVDADADCPEAADGSGYHDHEPGCGCNMLVALRDYEEGSKAFAEAIEELERIEVSA